MPQFSVQGQAAALYLQRNSFLAKGVEAERDLQWLFCDMKFRFRILQPPSASLGNNLKRGAALAAAVPMNRRDQGNGFSIFRLTLKIPPLKIRPLSFMVVILSRHVS